MTLGTVTLGPVPLGALKASVAGVTAAITGTATASITETDVVDGGKIIDTTITGDTLPATGAAFDAQRQNYINGFDSAQSEATGWNAEVRDKAAVTTITRISDTVYRFTLPASASYDVTAQEEITNIVPASGLVTSADPITATPTFTIDIVAAGSLLLINRSIANYGGMRQ